MTQTTSSLAFCVSALCLLSCGGPQGNEDREDPGLVVLEGDLANTFVTASEPAQVISRLRIDTRPLQNAARPPIHIALVVDTSGSMQGDAIRHAREASLALVGMLRPQDRLAVVAFHSETEVLLPSTRLSGADLRDLRRRIGRMEARGTTDLGGGLQAGLEELMRNLEPEGINRLVLLSDGVPNDATQVLPLAQAGGERGIHITALGLGLDYDETLLGRIAQVSGGRFHWIEESSAVASVFREEILRFERILARDMVLELSPGPGVRIDGVIGQPVSTGGSGVRVSLGDLSEGDHMDIIVRLWADPRRAGATVELMDAVLRFTDGVADAGALERRVFLGARATDNAQELENGRNVEVERQAARMMAAVVTVEAIELARAGDVDEARRVLDRAAAQAETAAAANGDARLQAQLAEMRGLGRALPALSAGAPSTDFEDGEMPAETVRRVHDSAMETIGY